MSSTNLYQLNILLIEDDEDDYFLIEDLLSEIEGTEFTIRWTSSYKTGLEVISNQQYDICLCDYQLGEYNGMEFLRTAMAFGCQIPIIILTGQEEREKYLEAMEIGAADYLVKGEISVSLLERSLRYAINRYRASKALRETEEQYALAAAGVNDGLWDWNLATKEVYFSERWQSMLGFSEDSIPTVLEDWFSRIHPEDIGRLKQDLKHHLQGKTPHFECEHRIEHEDGTYRWVLTRGLAVRNEAGKVYRMAGSQTDLTSRRSCYDQLTGLANRTLFLDQLKRAIARTARQPDYLLATIFLDCDRFKLINDSLGHLAGDRLLIQVAQRLEQCIRGGDLVARLGGDEFIILLENLTDIQQPIEIAKRINQELRQPFQILGHTIYISASMGISYNLEKGQTPEDLLRNADTAMYRAKGMGKARYAVFDQTMHIQAQKRLKLETDLRIAIDSEQFQLYYQPIINLADKKIIGFEALVRWLHPDKGLISPLDFIPIAEETGLIIPLSHWIVTEACRQMYDWQKNYALNKSLTISVNLSRKQFSEPQLAQDVAQILQQTKISPQNLKLEVTETALMNENEEAAAKILAQLKQLGVALSIDDFGTGYSSLSCLHQFPIDILKVDRSFISRIGTENKYLDIVQAIITIGRSLGLKVIAEGVETAQQFSQLQQLKCDYAQGYFFAKPLPVSAVEELLTKDLTKDR